MKTRSQRILSFLFVVLIVFTSVPFASAAETRTVTETFVSPFGISEASPSLYNVTAQVYNGCYGNQLTDIAEALYDALVQNYVEEKNTSEITLSLDYEFNSLTEMKTALSIAGQASIDAFTYDHPEIFWLKITTSSYSYSSGRVYKVGSYTIYPVQIYDCASDEIAEFDKAVDEAVNEISESISDKENRREVLLQIHNYVCERASYPSSFEESKIYSPSSFFLKDGYVVCEGYSKTFKILCDKFGIPCVLVSGTADTNTQINAPHMWNYVEMEDGRWYLVDTTWDDQDSRIYETYFLANYNSDGFYEKVSEERRADTDFSDTGKMQFVYPVLSTEAYVPHTHIWNSDFTVDKNAECEKDGLQSIHCSICDTTKNQTVIPQTGHDWQIASDKKVCSICGESELIPTEPVTVTTTVTTTATTEAKPTETTTVSTTATTTKPTEITTVSTTATITKPTETTTVFTTATATKPTETTTVSTTIPAEPTTVPVTEPSEENITKPSEEEQESEAVKKLSKVKGLKAKSITENSVKLSFKKVKGADKYTVYYSRNKKKWKSVKTHKTNVTVKKLKSGTKYYFKVKAVDGKNSSEQSDIITVVTKPSKVKLTSVKSDKKATVTVSWKAVTGADGYIVEYSTSKKFKKSKKKTVKKQKSKKTTIKKLKSGKKYYVRVKAYKTVNGKKVYGKVSNIKNIKVG